LIRHRAFPVAALVCIYALAVIVYSLVAGGHRFPNLFPDEMFYGKLSQGLAFGRGLEWRGSDWGLPPLWPSVLSLAWHSDSVPHGYAVAKVIGALVAPLAVIPTWVLGREIVGARPALVPALLTAAGSWMCVTSYLVSENLAFPLATASLACTVIAVRDTRSRWIAASAAFGAVAALARTQMLALGVILLLALVLDVVRQPRGARRARIAGRPRWVWIALAVVVVGGLLAFVVKPGLTNYDVLEHHASVGDIASTTGRHAVSAIVMLAFLPVVATLALMLRPANWRDDVVGPLLVTIAAAALVLFPLLGRFEAWATSGSPVERYAMYLAPLALVALVAAPGRISRAGAVAAAVVVVVALFASPITHNYIEQPALYGIQKRLFELSPFARDHLKLSLVFAAIPICGIGALALTTRADAAAGLALVAGVTGALTVMQTATSQHAEIALERDARARVLPAQLDWVDRHARGPVALLAIGDPQPLRGNSDLYTDFFNRKITRLISETPGAAPGSREYVLTPGSKQIRFRGQVVLAKTVRGTLIRVPAGAPPVSR
jgi:hypothetical protein